MTLGIRQTKDELDNSGTTYFGLRSSGGIPRAPGYSSSRTFDETTWRINLDHNFTDNIMAYLSYNRGYKMGQYLLVNVSGLPGPALDPEILDAYEGMGCRS